MNNKLKRILSSALVACMLLTAAPLYATSSSDTDGLSVSSEDVISSEQNIDSSSDVQMHNESASESDVLTDTEQSELFSEQDNETIEETESVEYDGNVDDVSLFNTNESENENWELDMVFYDSSVNNGQTALESIDWDASNNSYGEGKTRQITMQINYAHYDSLESYNPGDITITVPNFFKDEGQKTYGGSGNQSWVTIGNSECLIWEHDVYANTNGEEDYDWNCTFKKDNKGHILEYVFTNAISFEEIVNFEGSIQISYILIPREETPEKFDSECTHSFNESGKASLTVPDDENAIESNELTFNYTRTYTHPWKYKQYSIQKGAEILQSYDGLPQGASDYVWVKYVFSDNVSSDESRYPEIYARDTKKKDNIPTECKVYNKDMELMSPIDENTYVFTDNFIYVAYPRNIYNKENSNLNFTNKVELWGTYEDKTEEEFLAEGSVSINLSEYEITYKGEPLEVNKRDTDYIGMVRGNYLKQDMKWEIDVKAVYTGTPLTIKIEDSGMISSFTSYENSYFTGVTFPGNIKNLNGLVIDKNKYDCELWIKTGNKGNEYFLYDTFKNPDVDKSWSFSSLSEDVVGFYFLIKDMNESFIGTIKINSYHPLSGSFNGNVDNESRLSAGDKSVEAKATTSFSAPSSIWNQYSSQLEAQKEGTSLTKKRDEDFYTGQYTLGSTFSSSCVVGLNPWMGYSPTYNKDRAIKGFKMYDLLPYGVEITSTNEEILNSFKITNRSGNSGSDIVYIANDDNCSSVSSASDKELINNTETVINIQRNWKNTGRTKIEIIGTFKKPIFVGPSDFLEAYNQEVSFRYNINYKISTDDLLENKKKITNYVYAEHLENSNYVSFRWSTRDTEDINENNSTTDYLAYDYHQISVNSGLSTHQGIAKYVKTNKQPYSIGMVETDLNSEYTYKLRITTGQNDVTNLILYDSLEEKAWDKDGNIINAYGNNKHWNGEFLGIDTSYAEGNNYKVKTYYSENTEAGNLYNEDGSINAEWNEYMNPSEPLYSNGLKIKFSNNSRTYSSTDYVRIYYYKDGKYYCSQKLYGTNIAGKEIEVPSTDFYLHWYTYKTIRNYYGFSIDSIEPTYVDNNSNYTDAYLPNYTPIEIEGDNYPESLHNPYNEGKISNTLWHYTGESILIKEGHSMDMSKVKSLAFEYLDKNGNPAVIPKESVTYVEIKMKSPNTEYKTYAYNGCRSQWNVMNEFNLPVDSITGMHSNIVKVALPSSMEDKYINLNFNKIINATDTDFEKMKLDKDADYNFFISLTNQETGEVINGILDSKDGFRVNNIPIGTYIINEQNDIWFSFISMALIEPIEGIEFKEENGAYIISISASVESGTTANIEVNNKADEERFYDNKENINNLFFIN